jgi:hypothetical protein
VDSVVADVLRKPLPSWTVAAVALGIGVRLCATAQTAPVPVPASVDASLVLDAAGPEQRRSLSDIYLNPVSRCWVRFEFSLGVRDRGH